MRNKRKHYYAVLNGKMKKPTIYDSCSRCKKAIKDRPEAEYVVFSDVHDAMKYVEEKTGNQHFKLMFKDKDDLPVRPKDKICPICEKPHKTRTQCCVYCNKKRKHFGVSIQKALYLKEVLGVDDIFIEFEKKPFLIKSKVDYKIAQSTKKKIRQNHSSVDYRYTDYKKWEGVVPDYIKRMFNKYKAKEFLTLSGNRFDPNIHYVCKGCNEEQVVKIDTIGKGHDCVSSKSSGEIIVEEFLKQFCKIRTQFDTFKCINPVTGRQLPYDIEVVGKKVLIEIQGRQHNEFTPYFHGTLENFYYQLRKDDYKKRYAENRGYKLLYLYYEDFDDDSYRSKLNSVLG